jgi:hypothetical protein
MDESKPADPTPPPPATPSNRAASARAQRLAAALRDNLKRRKAAGRVERTEKPRN